MNIYGIQLDSAWVNKDENFTKVDTILNTRHIEKNSLLVLPEMFATGFSLEPSKTLTSEPQKTENYLSSLAKNKQCWVVAGMTQPSKQEGTAHNCAVFFCPEGMKISSYSKIHPIPILGEDTVHLAGSSVASIEIDSFVVTPLICYDLRFPEVFRLALKQETNVFIVIACWPKVRIEQWIILLQARAIENQSYVIGVNRVGKDPDLEYGGRSLIVDPLGKIITEGDENEGIIEANIEKEIIEKWRSQFPVIADIREEL